MDIGNWKNMTNAALCTNGSMTFKLATIAVYMLGFFFIVFLCNFLHILLRPLSQPRIFSECIVGLLLSNLPLIRKHTRAEGIRNTLEYIVDIAMVIHMFVVGLELDPNIFLEIHLPEAKVAYTGVLTTFVTASFLTPLLNIPELANVPFNLCLSVMVSGAASPLLTRLITDLKIGKSDIGRFVVSAGVHTDLVCIILICIGFIIFEPLDGFYYRSYKTVATMVSLLVVEMVLAAKLTPFIMNWVNRENPEGRPMKCSHLVIAVAYAVFICSFSPLFAKYNKILSSFLAGVFMPREGRVSKMMIIQANYFFNSIFYPIFFFWAGTEAQFSLFEAGKLRTWAHIFFIFLIATVGKVVGSWIAGLVLGFHWQDSVATGLLLNIKGHFHVYVAMMAFIMNYTTVSTSLSLVFSTILTTIYAPLVVASIIKRARRQAPTQRMAIQWLSPSAELRILLCLHGTQHIASAANFMGLARGPSDPGIMVYLADMIELTDRIAATLTHSEGMDTVSVADPAIVEMRDEISNGVNRYLDEQGDGITMQRMLALSTLSNMHQDVCILAGDLSVSLIVLPFHKQQEQGGRLSFGHIGFRHVNRKILRHAPCSVAILVDRGLGKTVLSRSSSVSLEAAVIFIGGKDDREALAYAGRVSCHPGVKLTVIRFLVEATGDSMSSIITMAKANTVEHQEEMKVDDECFADFYDKHVAGGHVAYMEKYLSNSGQTFSTLRSLEEKYGLFIVGRGGRVNSILTKGMNDWEECPELGPIADILSASDFSTTASVLIIQQHSLKGDLDGLQEGFSIM